MDTRVLRIAILEADTPAPKARARYGSYGGVFTSLLYKAADASGIDRSRLQTSGWDVVNTDPEGEEEACGGLFDWNRTKGYPALDSIDGILITGSKYNAFENDSWVLRLVEYVQHALKHPHVRIIGVCYGHQIVARALGAQVVQNDRGGWEASVSEVQQTAKGKLLFGNKDVVRIHQSHKDIVQEYPPNVDKLGFSDVCKVQGMYAPARLITVQGHPEFTKDIMEELLIIRHDQGIFDDIFFADATRRVSLEQDGVLVAQAFLALLLE